MRRTRLSIRVWAAARAAWVAAAVLALSGSAQAGIIAAWDFSGEPGGSNNYGSYPCYAVTTDEHATVGSLTRGSGVGTTGIGASKAWGGNDWSATTRDGAIAANEFVTFSLTAKAGYDLSLDNIGAYNIRLSSTTGPTSGIWQYALDGQTFVDIGSTISWGASTSVYGNGKPAIGLSGVPALQHVAAGTSVTFRVVNWGATETGGAWYFNDPPTQGADWDFVVNGTTSPVPEPGPWALLLTAGLLLLAIRFRASRVAQILLWKSPRHRLG